jgi:hypothetical protein
MMEKPRDVSRRRPDSESQTSSAAGCPLVSGALSWDEVMGTGAQAPPPPPSTAANAPGLISWDEAMAPVAPPPSAPGASPTAPKLAGVIANTGAGANDAIAGTIGLPVDAATGAINLGIRGLNSVAGTHLSQIDNPVGGSNSIKSLMGTIGADPRDVVTEDGADQVARGMGAGIASTILPWSVARAFPVVGGVAGALQRAIGGGSASTMALAGAGGGAVGQVAANLAPDQWKSTADAAGNILGGGLIAGSVEAGKALIDGATHAVGGFLDPMLGRSAPVTDASGAPVMAGGVPIMAKPGQTKLAGMKIQGAATDPNAVRDTLANPPAPLVPGSEPTTFQLTGDSGLGQLERAVSKPNAQLFLDRADEQNAARVGAIQNLAPADASPEAVGRAFQAHLANLDAQGADEQAQALQGAQQATSGLGGAVPAGADQQASVLQRFGQTIRGNAPEPWNGTPGAGLAGAQATAKANVSKLFDAVDPDGTLTVPMQPLKAAVRDIMKSQPQNAAPLGAETQRIFDTTSMQPAVQTFPELAALRSRITTQLRVTRQDPALANDGRLLTQLLDNVNQSLQNGVETKAASDAQAVAAGVLDPENAIAAKLNAESQRWIAARQAQARTGGNPGEGFGGNGFGGPDAFSGAPGAEGAPRGRFGNPAGNQGLSGGPEPVANWTQEAADRYAAARAGHAQRKSIFDTAPGVGAVLKSGPTHGTFALADSSVPAALFTGGKGAAERIQAFQKVAPPEAHQALQDYAAFDLRRSAEMENGTLDPRKYQVWMGKHQEVMSAFPELAQRFQTAAAARDALDDATGRRVEAVTAYQKSAAKPFLGDSDPVTAVGKILGSDRALPIFKELAAKTANNPDARAGLKKSVVEFILRDLKGNQAAGDTGTEFLKSDATQTFIKKTPQALSQIFTPEQVEAIRNIAADLQRANKSVAGSKLPGQSNTVQDLAAGHKHASHSPSGLNQIMGMELAEHVFDHLGGHGGEHVAHGVVHKVAGAVTHGASIVATMAAMGMRRNGLQRVDQLVTLAMLHPDLAKALLTKTPDAGSARMMGQVIARKIAAITAAQINRPPMPPITADPDRSGDLSPAWDAPRVSAFAR